MTNKVFAAISKHRSDMFRAAFCSVSKEIFYDAHGKLIHPGEFGTFRERICADYLALFMPTYLRVGTGFLINAEDKVSTQCDLVIFDPEFTPLVEDSGKRRFFPVETVVGIAEVKSTLSKAGFLEALVKLARSKQLRDDASKGVARQCDYLINEDHHYNTMASFIICEKLSFSLDNITVEITKHYDKENVDPLHRHNLVLSVTDGIFCYANSRPKKEKTWMYPVTNGQTMKNCLVTPGVSDENHFGIFNAYLFQLMAMTTVFLPEIARYDRPQTIGEAQTET